MPQAVVIEKYGDPSVLQMKEVKMPSLGASQVLIRHTAIGVNFIDTKMRVGELYPPELPCILGFEAVGIVEKVGGDVKNLMPGHRVVYATHKEPGAYQEYRVMSVSDLIMMPEKIDDATGAAIFFKGLTAQYLIKRAFRAREGHAILVHAAGGVVGQILSQWAMNLGCLVIGTIGSEEKRKLAEVGCHLVLNCKEKDWVEKVMEYTQGIGVNAAYDSIGKETFNDSLRCLMPAGIMVNYGSSSGQVDNIDLAPIRDKSLFLTCPSIFDYKANRNELILSADELFQCYMKEGFKVKIHKKYNLSDAALAHKEVESRKLTGPVVLIP